MSRYLVNKFMRLVNANEWALKEYVAAPAAFVAKWQREPGHQLTEQERVALGERDYEALYAMGAHPFLLWSFTQAIWEHEVHRERLVENYKAKATPIGYPDFTT